MGTPTAVQLQASCQWTNSHSWWHAWAAHHSWCFIHFRHPGIISDCVKQLDIFWEWFSTGRTSVEMFSMITFLPANCVEICKTTSALKMMHIYDVTMWQVLDSVLLPHTVNQFLKKREPIWRANLLKFFFFMLLWKFFNGILRWTSDMSILNSHFQCRPNLYLLLPKSDC